MPTRVHAAAFPLIARVSLDPSASLGHMLGEERTREAFQTLLRRLHRVVPSAARVARVGLLDLVYPVDPRRVNQGHDLGPALQAAARAAIVAVGGQALPAPDVRIAPWGSAGDQPSPAMDDALGARAAHDLDAATEHALALLALLDARDPQAATHAWHVSVIAERLAAALGLDAPARATCALAGLVHDLGKAALPDRILFHPGPLPAGDWSHIHRHPATAASVLARAPELRVTTPAVLHHHERIDGAGYPAGLAGDQIPLDARILAVADTYSALTAHRPYRAAHEPGAALAYVEALAGTQLDREVVAALQVALAPTTER